MWTKEKWQEYRKQYHLKNRDKILARKKIAQKEKSKDPEWLAKRAASSRRYYERNRKHVLARNLEYIKRIKKLVFEHYGGACTCCGETEPAFLAIDHINGGGNKHRKEVGRGGSHFYTWVYKNNYPENLQILCHNCNTAKHFQGICPHQKV